MTEVVTEHQCARKARLLVVVTPTAAPPVMSRDRLPDDAHRFRVFGDGSTAGDVRAAREYAAEERRGLDARAEVGWVWIGHDQYFYHSDWQFYHCFGPDGWNSDQRIRSDASFAKVEEMDAARKKAERLAALATKGKKKEPRIADTIAGV